MLNELQVNSIRLVYLIFVPLVVFTSSCTHAPKYSAPSEAFSSDLSVDSNAKLIGEEPSLRFPSSAHSGGKSGYVEVEFLVNKSGNVGEIRILKEEPEGYGFGRAAIDHVRKLKFRPAVAKGSYVEEKFTRRYDFKLSLNQITKP